MRDQYMRGAAHADPILEAMGEIQRINHLRQRAALIRMEAERRARAADEAARLWAQRGVDLQRTEVA